MKKLMRMDDKPKFTNKFLFNIITRVELNENNSPADKK